MTCIICRNEKPPSAEHVIPRALGGSFVVRRICRECNSMLGANRSDQGLIDHHESVARRVALQLAGNNGTVPDPVGDAIKFPIETDIPNVKVRLYRDGEDLRARVQPHVEVKVHERPNGDTVLEIEFIIDGDDATNAEMYLRSALKKAGIKDEPRLTEICTEFLPQLVEREGPASVAIPMKKNEGGHHLGMTKIAYEMAHHWLGDAWLDEPIAVSMRDALQGNKAAGGQYKVGDGNMMDRVRISTAEALPFEERPLGYNPTRTKVMSLHPIGEKLFVCIWLLEAFCAMYLVSENGAVYQRPECDAVLMDVVIRQAVEVGTVMQAA
jgi:hypothetical protein